MNEYMLLIRNIGDSKSSMSPTDHETFVRKCESYISELRSEGKLIAAQPLNRQGVVISHLDETWIETPVDPHKTIQVGYYHILASDNDEATAIAKRNPEFEFTPGASIEVRPIKTKEQTTGFTYPK